MGQYLDKFKGTAKKRQTEQILRLLNKQKNAGQIRTVEEFTTRLDNLVRELTGSVLKPSLSLFPAEPDHIIDSDTLNFMLDRVENDLETAFEEANNISEVQKDHEAIVRDVVLKNLRYGIAELETKVSVYEFLNGNEHGLDSAIFSTFRESRDERTTRSAPQASTLFIDPKTQLAVPLGNDAEIDLIGERLTLAPLTNETYSVATARQIFDETCPQSERIVASPTSPLSNVIDDTTGTYWVQSQVYKDNTNTVRVKVELELPAVRPVNFVELEPAVRFPVTLESIYYQANTGKIEKLVDPDLVIESTTSYIFETVSTRKIILLFKITTPKRTEFQFRANVYSLFYYYTAKTNGQLATPPFLNQIPDEFRNVLLSTGAKELVSIIPGTPLSQFSDSGERPPAIPGSAPPPPLPPNLQFAGWEYQIGFDNLRIGKTAYRSDSIYVSRSLKIEDVAQIALKVDEARPSIDNQGNAIMTDETYDTEDDVFFRGSIEYWVLKRDFDSNDNIIYSSTFPILPFGVSRVNQERLLLTEKSGANITLNDVGSVNFFTTIDDGNVKVFRNGILLPESSWQDVTLFDTPNIGTPMRFRIKIPNALPGDIYTVSYIPVESNTISVPQTLDAYSPSGLSVVDLVGDMTARLVNDKLVLLSKGSNADKIVRSELFLIIALRNNVADPTVTPTVEEYTLAAGERKESKFDNGT